MNVRSWLLNTAAVDVLTEMNERLRRCDSKPCVCVAIFDFSHDDRCSRFNNDCNKCIQSALNEQK